MITSFSPVAENYQKIRIDDFVRQARNSLKKAIVEAQFAIDGHIVALCESKTRFGGNRFWFECPVCQRRSGAIYREFMGNRIACRKCIKPLTSSMLRHS